MDMGRGLNLCGPAKTDVGYSNVDDEDVNYMLVEVEGFNLRQPTKTRPFLAHIRVWRCFYLGQALISPQAVIHHHVCTENIKPGIAAVYNS